jgi:hypothetical protein
MPPKFPELPSMNVDAAECRELLDRVVNSRELSRAQRLRELLCYLGKRSLKPHASVVREQEIGAAVFGRPEEYDTGLDNIVRVNVSELRKRLAHYFAAEGASETLLMEIPRGGYVPVFYRRAMTPPAAEANSPGVDAALQPAAPQSVTPQSVTLQPAAPQPAVGFVPPAAPLPAVPAPPAVVEVTPPEVQSGVLARLGLVGWLTVVALTLSLGGCVVLAWQNYLLRARIRPWNAEPVRAAFWSEFYQSGDEVDIVTADTSFALEQDLLGRSISLSDYLDYSYKNLAGDPKLTPDTRAALKLVLDRNNGSIGDFLAAERFMDLDAHSPTVKLEAARSETPESIKSNNVILIGSRESNPWVELYGSRMNFFMEYEPVGQRTYIVNRNPQPGERSIYESTAVDRSRGYSVVTFMPNLSDHRYVLIVSGSDSQATRAAGEFVTSSEGLAQIRQKMPQGRFPFFEIVLGSSRLVGTTLNTEILAYRLHPR